MPRGTFADAMESMPVKLAMYALIVGIAWANLKAEVTLKADMADLVPVARDVATIKAILCGQASADSFCHIQR